MIEDIVDRLRRAETAPLDPDNKMSLFLVLSDARAQITRLRDERRWIPVGERLPEEGRLVLWYCPDERWPVTSGRFERPYHMNWGGDMSVPISEGGYTHWMPLPAPGYTHWMPLPAPPSEGEVEG